MDDGPVAEDGQPDPPNAWAAPQGLVALAWVLAVGTLAWTVLGVDPAGRILTALATVGLVLFALFGTIARPRLRADADGIEIRRLTGRQSWPWRAVRIRVSTTRRLGRSVSLLELDAQDDDDQDDEGHLIVLGWLDLGTEPAEVAAALRSYWN
jgi:hypothetical protein